MKVGGGGGHGRMSTVPLHIGAGTLQQLLMKVGGGGGHGRMSTVPLHIGAGTLQ